MNISDSKSVGNKDVQDDENEDGKERRAKWNSM